MSEPNPYDAFVDMLPKETATVGSALYSATQEPLGSSLNALRLSALTGVPTDVAQDDPDSTEQIHRSRSIARDEIARSPALQKFLATPAKANAYLFVQKDLLDLREAVQNPPPMREERTFQRVGGETNVRGGELVKRHLLGLLTPAQEAEYAALETKQSPDPDLARALGVGRSLLGELGALTDVFRGVPRGQAAYPGVSRSIPRRVVSAAAAQLPLLKSMGWKVAGYATAGAAIGAVVEGVPAVALAGPAGVGGIVHGGGVGASAGAVYGGFKGSFDAGLYGSYEEFNKVKLPDGKIPSRNLVVGMAVAAATVKAGLDAAAFANLAAKTPGFKKLFAGGELLSAERVMSILGKDPATSTVLEKFGANYLSAIAGETLTEPIQEAVDVAAAAVVGERPVGAALAAGAPRIQQAGEQAFLATAAFGAFGPGVTAIREKAMGAANTRDLLNRSEASREHIADIIKRADVAALTRLRNEAPEAHRELMQGVMDEDGLPDVFMSPAKLLDLWGKAGKGVDELPQSVRDQLGDAMFSGRDLVIPTGDFLTYLSPVLKETSAGHVRTGPDLLTAEESAVVTDGLEADLATLSDVSVPEGATPIIANEALFGSAEDAGMTRAEYEAYTRLRDEAVARPTARIEDGKVRELARRRGLVTRVLRARDRLDSEATAAVKQQVTNEVNDTPVWRADRFLRTGEILLPNGKTVASELGRVKIDRAAVIAMLGKTPYGLAAEGVPTGGQSWLAAKGGVHPDVLAEQLGFATGNDLVRALIDAGSHDAASRTRVIDAETQKRVRAAEGAPPGETELTLLRSTLEDDVKIDRLIMEERALAKKTGQKSFPRKVLMIAADRIIRHGEPSTVRSDLYRAAADRERRAALKSYKAGDLEEAAAHVRRETLNRMLAIAAVEARHETNAKLRDLKKWDSSAAMREKIAKAGGEWLAQRDGLLERVDLRKRSKAQRLALSTFLNQAGRDGASILMPDWLVDGPKAFQDLTLDQVRGLHAAVKSIQNAAVQSYTVQRGAEQMALDDAAEVAVLEVRSLPGRAQQTTRAGKETTADIRRSFLRAQDATLTRKEALIAAISGPFGTESHLYTLVIRRLHDAQSRYDEYQKKYGNEIDVIEKAMSHAERKAMREVLPERRFVWTKEDGTAQTLEITRWDLVSMLLNLGSESNKKKLLEGYGISEATVRDIIEQHAEKADVKLAVKLQAIVESLWPEVEAQKIRLEGVAPEKIVAVPHTAKGVTLPGGYWPIFYHPGRSNVGQRAAIAELDFDRPSGFAYPTTSHDFDKSRTEVTAPLLLQFDQIMSRHLDEVFLDLAFRESLLDVSKLMKHKDVNAAMTEVLGPEFNYANFWRPWLQKIAGDSVYHGAMGWEETAARQVRFHAGVFVMGANVTTLMVQPTSLANAVNVLEQQSGIGRTEITRLLAEALHISVGKFAGTEAAKIREAVHELSVFMRNRVVSSNPDYRDLVRRMAEENKMGLDAAEMAMGWIAKTQYHTADLPTWLAAHRIALDHKGLSDADAIFFADSIVRLAHGAGSKIDMPATLAESSQVGRLFKMFYSYANTVYGQIRETHRRTGSLADTFSSYFWSLALPSAWAAATTALYSIGTGDDPDKALRRIPGRMIGDHFGLHWLGRMVGDLVTAGVDQLSGTDSGQMGARDPEALGIVLREGWDLVHPTGVVDAMFDVARTGALLAFPAAGAPLRQAERIVRNVIGEDTQSSGRGRGRGRSR